MTETSDQTNSGRLRFLMIVAIAVVPIVVAWIAFFYFRDLAPSQTTNEGHLVIPPRHAEEIAETPGNRIPLGDWAMLIPTGPECGEDCEQLLYLSRQVRTGLGKDARRVKRYLLVGDTGVVQAFSELLRAEHGDVAIRYYSAGALTDVFGNVVDDPLAGSYLFLMDPNGNIMMYYTVDLAGKPMLKDIKHLLRISTIG